MNLDVILIFYVKGIYNEIAGVRPFFILLIYYGRGSVVLFNLCTPKGSKFYKGYFSLTPKVNRFGGSTIGFRSVRYV